MSSQYTRATREPSWMQYVKPYRAGDVEPTELKPMALYTRAALAVVARGTDDERILETQMAEILKAIARVEELYREGAEAGPDVCVDVFSVTLPIISPREESPPLYRSGPITVRELMDMESALMRRRRELLSERDDTRTKLQLEAIAAVLAEVDTHQDQGWEVFSVNLPEIDETQLP